MLQALLVAAALLAPGTAQADENRCDFVPPTPLLRNHAYAGQTFKAIPVQNSVETASLSGGVRLTINQSQCVDEQAVDFVLTVPNDPKKQNFVAWTDFTQGVLRKLKVREPWPVTDMIDFLKKARAMTPKDGVVAMCQDGTIADDCDWNSGGILSIAVKPGATTTQVTITESISG